MHDVKFIIQETTGLAWYELMLDLEKREIATDQTWPEMDNTDTEIVGLVLNDDKILRKNDPDTGARFAEEWSKLEEIEPHDHAYANAQDELYFIASEIACEEWPSDALNRKNAEALDRINKILSVDNWGVGMLEDICAILRTVRQPHPEPEWMAH